MRRSRSNIPSKKSRPYMYVCMYVCVYIYIYIYIYIYTTLNFWLYYELHIYTLVSQGLGTVTLKWSTLKGTEPFELDTHPWIANSKHTCRYEMGKAMYSPSPSTSREIVAATKSCHLVTSIKRRVRVLGQPSKNLQETLQVFQLYPANQRCVRETIWTWDVF
jgi:hypothetical protein